MPWPRITETPEEVHIHRLLAATLKRRVLRSRLLGEGAFGVTYLLDLEGSPGRVVLKWQKCPGQAAREARQLEELRRHAIVKVPRVLCCHVGSDDVPFEALVLEYLDGQPAAELPAPPADVGARFAREAIDVLLHWHTIRRPAGYGPLGGPFHARWVDYYRQRMCAYWDEVRAIPAGQNNLPPETLAMAQRSLDAVEAIIGHRQDGAVLLHSDYWLANIMVEPATYRITGVIDPLDAEWGDRELDLILLNVYWARPLDLLGEYCRRVPPDEQFELRQVFYRFWYEIQNYARIRWREDGLNESLAQRLGELMDKCL